MRWYSVTRVALSFDGHFECRHCEYDCPATVSAKSVGSARGWDSDAQFAARENAEQSANEIAGRTLQFVKCPRCGKTDPAGWWYRAKATIGAIAVGFVTVFASLLILEMMNGHHDEDLTEWSALGFGAFITVLLYWSWGRPWRSPDRRTTFR